jgi:ribosomal protein S18 acetylase RimI-like enzyme
MKDFVSTVREMRAGDVKSVAAVHRAVFPRQAESESWIAANFRARPRVLGFVVTHDTTLCGYIFWIEKGGFRKEAILELEQIGIHPSYQGRGLGERLVRESFVVVKRAIKRRGSRIKLVLVTTRADNYAQRLYEKTLGAVIEVTISNFYTTDEVIMVVRNPSAPD